ncbi:unnamed protein product [Closterium sp. Naga37s-1]|nr:unnamed protein product [Closterium sp. Naga37s-1]
MWPFGNSEKQQALPLRHEGGRSYYDVQPGDNLTKIAGQLGSTVEILMQANALRSDLLHPGQSLWVPRTYTIAKGDTLYAIARPIVRGSRPLGATDGGHGGMGGGGTAGGAFGRGGMGGIMASQGGGGEAALEKQV